MRWYLKVNPIELDVPEAIKALEDIRAKGWEDYLILPTEFGFNVLRGLEELLKDPDHTNGFYQILNEKGKRPTRPKVSITGTRAVYNDLMIFWSPEAEVSTFYYREDSDLDLIKKFGIKDPVIIIKCST